MTDDQTDDQTAAFRERAAVQRRPADPTGQRAAEREPSLDPFEQGAAEFDEALEAVWADPTWPAVVQALQDHVGARQGSMYLADDGSQYWVPHNRGVTGPDRYRLDGVLHAREELLDRHPGFAVDTALFRSAVEHGLHDGYEQGTDCDGIGFYEPAGNPSSAMIRAFARQDAHVRSERSDPAPGRGGPLAGTERDASTAVADSTVPADGHDAGGRDAGGRDAGGRDAGGATGAAGDWLIVDPAAPGQVRPLSTDEYDQIRDRAGAGTDHGAPGPPDASADAKPAPEWSWTGEREQWDAVGGDDPRSYSAMMGDAAAALGAAEVQQADHDRLPVPTNEHDDELDDELDAPPDGRRRGGRQWSDGPGAPPGADRPGEWPAPDDSDGWFSSGLDDAHQAHLDDLGRVDKPEHDSTETAAEVGRAHRAVADVRAWPARSTGLHSRPDGLDERDTLGAPQRDDDLPVDRFGCRGDVDEWGAG